MDNPGKIIRVIFLDFRKAFDLIDHNKLLNTFIQIGVRPALVGWFASYLKGRSQVSTFQGDQSDLKRIKGGVPQGSKLGPIAFIIKINQLPVVTALNEQERSSDAAEDQDTVLFMDDTTLSEVINVSKHSTGSPIGNTQRNVNRVVQFAKEEKMELNERKCKEMLIDFRRNKSVIPPISIGEQNISRVKS